ncbi:MAG: hypothetical protein HQK83_07330 [Fibrobacteria bacterium]|nr:hypothetical protein [Fibrobacteria bacterium]
MNTLQSQHKREFSMARALFFLFLGLFGILAIVSVVVYFALVAPAKSYVSDTPFELIHEPVDKTAEQKVITKITSFVRSDSVKTTAFNSREINHLIRTNKRIKDAKIKYKVTLEDSLFNIRCVVPTNNVSGPLKKFIETLNITGYINAEVEGYLRMQDGKLMLISTRAEINGQPAPFMLLGKRTHIDVSKFFQDDKKYNKMINRLEGIKIKDRKMLITKK